jgi:hypothetical protein
MDSPKEERKETRGQIANENRLTSGNCPTRACCERLYCQPIPTGASDPKTTRGDGMRHFVTHSNRRN